MAEQTYAQQAKAIMNKYKLRLGDKFDKGDPLAIAAMNAELSTLQQEQEQARAVKAQAQRVEQQETIQQFQEGGNLFQNMFANTRASGNYGNMLMYQNPYQNNFQVPQAPNSLGAFQAAQSGGVNLGHQGASGFNFNQPGGGQSFNLLNVSGGNGSSYATPGGDVGGFASRVPWSSAISGIGDIIANSIKVDAPQYDYEEYKPTKARANLVDYRREREQIQRERDLANAQIARSARGTGSQAGLMENILAGQTATQRTAGQQFGQSLEREGNVNAQIKNQVQARNQQMDLQAFQVNERNKQFANSLERADAVDSNVRKQNMVQAGFGSVSQYLQDRQQASQYDQMVNMEMARNPNYSLQQADPTFWRRFAGITDPITNVNFRNTNDKSNV